VEYRWLTVQDDDYVAILKISNTCPDNEEQVVSRIQSTHYFG